MTDPERGNPDKKPAGSKRKLTTKNKSKDDQRRSLEEKRVSEVEYLNIQDDEIDDNNFDRTRANSSNNKSTSTAASQRQHQMARSVSSNSALSGNGAASTSQGKVYNQEPAAQESAAAGGYPRIGRSDSTTHILAAGDSGSASSDPYQQQPTSKFLTKNLVWAVLASTVGSSFQHGYNIGVTNAPEKLIGQFINDTYHSRHSVLPSDGQIDLIFAIIVSIYCVGGCIGALLTAFVADRIGRKEGLFYNNILVLLACPLMASSRSLSSYELLIVGRLIIGINAGLNAGLAPLYLNEISPLALRGALGTIYQLVITISIFLSNIFALPGLFGTQELWPFLFAIPLLPAAIMLITLPHCCESPKHLLLNKGQELRAQQALAWLRETGEIQDEMDDLRAENEFQKQAPQITLRELTGQRYLRKPLIISIVIMLSQQFSGINAVLFFSTSIFRDAGLSQMAALKATLGMSLVNVVMTVVSLFLVDRAGRKTLHMSGLMGMAVTCLILALCLGSSPDQHPDQTSSMIAVVSVYVFIVMFASGPGSIPWFLVSELFPSNARPMASSIAVSVNWLANFTVSLCFLPLSNVLHGFTFFIFAGLLIVFFLFTYYKVPETKGASAEEISALFIR